MASPNTPQIVKPDKKQQQQKQMATPSSTLPAERQPQASPAVAQSGSQMMIEKRYVLGGKINQGAFGKVYKVLDTFNKNVEYAAKFEIKKPNQSQTINNDYYIMKGLKRSNPSCLVPTIHHFGQISNSYVLIMDLMGPSVEDLFTLLGKKFSVKTVILLSLRMLRALDTVHECGIIHRDIKPDNFVMGGSQKNSQKVFLIDFGLSKRYVSKSSSSSYAARTKTNPRKNSLTGTVRYVSTSIHDGYDATKWDDLMSLGYIMVYLSKGSLPWMGLRAEDTAQKYEKICNKKKSIPITELCDTLPRGICEFLQSIRKNLASMCPTGRITEPDYVNYYLSFRACAASLDIKLDFIYDWSDKNFDAMSIAVKKSNAVAAKNNQANAAKMKPPVQIVQSKVRENPFDSRANEMGNQPAIPPQLILQNNHNSKDYTDQVFDENDEINANASNARTVKQGTTKDEHGEKSFTIMQACDRFARPSATNRGRG